MHREGHHARTRLEPVEGGARHAKRLAAKLAFGVTALGDDEEVLVRLEHVRGEEFAQQQAVGNRCLCGHVRLP
eukprot:4076558-Prymnesium_polylepis.2